MVEKMKDNWNFDQKMGDKWKIEVWKWKTSEKLKPEIENINYVEWEL
jgi:hypothetical protein